MSNTIGIRKEDKNKWETRVALTPQAVSELSQEGVKLCVERFPARVFKDEEYKNAGADLMDDVRSCDLVLGIKETPKDYFRNGKAYMFFSHTIKGQSYNMEMLSNLVRKKCTLMDYELITDEKERRLIFFGRHAGLAGMIDTFYTIGQRLNNLNIKNPFSELKQTYHYKSLIDAKNAVSKVGQIIREHGIPKEIAPLTVGFAGYGNVSKGAQEIFDLLPHVQITKDELSSFVKENKDLTNTVVKVEYKEEDMVKRKSDGGFELMEYYNHPEKYEGIFGDNLKYLSIIINAIFWNEKYPRLATKDDLKNLFAGEETPKLLAVGDISCDVDGAMACTVAETDIGDPVFMYDPGTHKASFGFEGSGIAVMAVSNLPTQLPAEASQTFSDALTEFIVAISKADFNGSFDNSGLPDPVRRSCILWKGEFTDSYQYMKEFIK